MNITMQLEDTLLRQIIGLPSELQLPNRENGISLLQCIVLTSAPGPRASSAIAIAVSIAFRIVRHNRYCAAVCILSPFHAKRRSIRFASVRIRTRGMFVGCSGGLFLFYSMFGSTADQFSNEYVQSAKKICTVLFWTARDKRKARRVWGDDKRGRYGIVESSTGQQQ